VAIAKPAAPKKPRKKSGSKAATTGAGEEDQTAVTEGEATDGTKSKKKKAKVSGNAIT
jgi:hypothetical protein